jgi:hypothetical protein
MRRGVRSCTCGVADLLIPPCPHQSFYNLQALGQDGRNHSMAEYAGNVTLVVNVASF